MHKMRDYREYFRSIAIAEMAEWENKHEYKHARHGARNKYESNTIEKHAELCGWVCVCAALSVNNKQQQQQHHFELLLIFYPFYFLDVSFSRHCVRRRTFAIFVLPFGARLFIFLKKFLIFSVVVVDSLRSVCDEMLSVFWPCINKANIYIPIASSSSSTKTNRTIENWSAISCWN